MKIAFVTAPKHDDATYYLSVWCGLVFDNAGQKGINVVRFEEKRANKKDVESFLNKKNPGFVVFNGHGSEDSVAGHKNEVLIKSGENEALLKDKIVYCIACSSAAKLGEDSVNAGAISFVGYSDEFTFISDPSKYSSPTKDEFAKPFFESSNQLINSILKGNTIGDSFNKSQETFDAWIEKLQRSDAPPEAAWILWGLIWDKHCQKVLGKKDADF